MGTGHKVSAPQEFTKAMHQQVLVGLDMRERSLREKLAPLSETDSARIYYARQLSDCVAAANYFLTHQE